MSSYDAALVSTAMIEHPDLLELPRGVRYLYVEALIWSRLHHTDGAIPRHMPRHFSDEPDPDAAAAALVEAGRWAATTSGWTIVGFEDTQMTAERVAKRRADARARWDKFVAVHGGRKARKPNDSPSNRTDSIQRVRQRVSNGSDLTRPDLTRIGKVGGKGIESRASEPIDFDAARATNEAVLADPKAPDYAKRAATKWIARHGEMSRDATRRSTS